MVFGGLRVALRAVWDRPSSQTRPGADANPTLLYGAGRAGVLMARSARRDPDSGLTPVGFLDDDLSLIGSVIASPPVFGDVGALPRAVEATGAQTLLITMPGAPGPSVRRVLEAALALKLRVRTIPHSTATGGSAV
ncbi:MAG: nucleoside-diphosphate sugar epimerase/dehydratase [Euzebya sp.]